MGGVAFQMEGFILSVGGAPWGDWSKKKFDGGGSKQNCKKGGGPPGPPPMPPTTMENPAPQPHPLLLTTTWKTLKPVNEWCAIALAHAHKYQY